MPTKSKNLIQMVTYVPPPLKGKADAARKRASMRMGHPISESAYLKKALEQRLAKVE